MIRRSHHRVVCEALSKPPSREASIRPFPFPLSPPPPPALPPFLLGRSLGREGGRRRVSTGLWVVSNWVSKGGGPRIPTTICILCFLLGFGGVFAPAELRTHVRRSLKPQRPDASVFEAPFESLFVPRGSDYSPSHTLHPRKVSRSPTLSSEFV